MNREICVQQICKSYGDVRALQSVTFHVKEGELFGLIGPDGSGKTSLFRILTTLLLADSGTATVCGLDVVRDYRQIRWHVGYMPGRFSLYPDLTVEEYLSYCAKLHYIPKGERGKAITKALERCNISHFRKRLLRNLSGGYQQRVGIAQAIIHEPDFVVLDEPTNGLDPNQILDVRRLIKEVAEEHTVLLSTHILSEVQAICDHIYMIEKGKMVFNGTVSEFDNYIVPTTLIVTLAANPPAEALREIRDVLSVEKLENSQYRLQFTDITEAIEQVVEISVARGWGVEEIYPEKSSLDEVFAELSKK